MNLEKMEDVLNQYISLIKNWCLPRRSARIQITGGEPFIRKDFMHFLEKIHAHSHLLNWTIMSNGSYLTKALVKNLRLLGIDNFQVSLEGTEKANDEIRGAGSFLKALRAIELLSRANINVSVSLTLTKKNCQEIKNLADILASSGVRFFGVRRFVPLGISGSQLKNLVLEPQELRLVYQQIEEINKQMREKKYPLRITGGCENAIFNDEISAPDLMGNERCAVADGRILTIMPDGTVLVCRRYPVIIGNLYKDDLKDIYYSKSYEALKAKKDNPIECYFCPNWGNCFGGAKCVTRALTGKTCPDVQCWKLFKNIEQSTTYIKSPSLFKKLNLSIKNLVSFKKKLQKT